MFGVAFDAGVKLGARTYCEQKYQYYQVALMVDTTHVKAHQDATRSPLIAQEQKLGKTKGGRNTKLSACVNLAEGR